MADIQKYNTDFAKRLRILRDEQEMTQFDLGEKLGVTEQLISNWENLKADPKLTMLIQLSKTFNVSIDYLAGLSDKRNYSDDNDNIQELTQDLEELLQEIRDNQNNQNTTPTTKRKYNKSYGLFRNMTADELLDFMGINH